MLAPDATVYGDGGGKARSIREPLVGALRVAKALIGWALDRGRGGRHVPSHDRERRTGHRLLLARQPPGRVQELEIADGLVVAVRTVLNPDKLAHLAVA